MHKMKWFVEFILVVALCLGIICASVVCSDATPKCTYKCEEFSNAKSLTNFLNEKQIPEEKIIYIGEGEYVSSMHGIAGVRFVIIYKK